MDFVRQIQPDRHRHPARVGHVLPGEAVRRVLGGEVVAPADQLHPARGEDAALHDPHAGRAVVGAVAEQQAVLRGDREDRVLRARVRRVGDQDPGPGPALPVAQAVDAGDDLPVAGQPLVDEAVGVVGAFHLAAGTAQDDASLRRLQKRDRGACEPQAEPIDAAGGPILRLAPGPLGFGVVGRLRVVVVEGHGPRAATDAKSLGARDDVADGRAGPVDPAVDPGLVDPAAVLVVVALEVVDRDEVGGGELPDVPFPRAPGLGLVDFVDPPVVRGAPVQRVSPDLRQMPRQPAQIDVGAGGRRAGDRGEVAPEVDVVLCGLPARRPAERQVVLRLDSAVGGEGLAGP